MERHALLSIVIPAYNEEVVLPEFHRRLSTVVDGMGTDAEFIFINDGSADSTLNVLQKLRQTDRRIGIVDLSRNFGKEIALTAGLDHARGDAAVVIDADLQDPPEVIPQLVEHWLKGYDVVYAQRIAREGESFLKKTTASAFYRLMRRVGRVTIPPDTGDFRLLSRRAVEALTLLREQHRFMKGLFAWIGYSQIGIPYRRDPRYAGQTKWNYWALWNFALEGITSFTTMPLRIATYLGFITALAAFSYGSFIVLKKLFFGDPVPGYPSLIAVVTFLGGMQLIAIGVIGEYLGRLFDESKRRPLYLLNAYEPSHVDELKTEKPAHHTQQTLSS